MSFSVAYGMKRKKMKDGGEVEHHSPAGGSSNRAKAANRMRREDPQHGVHKSQNVYVPGSSKAGYNSRALDEGAVFKDQAKSEHEKVINESRSMPKPKLKGLADGGMVKASMEDEFGSSQPQVKDHKPSYMNEAAHKMKTSQPVSEEHALPSVEHDEDEPHEAKPASPFGYGLAEGGEVDELIERIMKHRAMSEGGKVANEDHGPHESKLADFDPNEFDDLTLRDDLEEHYTGANSGDKLGNEQLDHDEDDMISRIMKSRTKKDRLPNPR